MKDELARAYASLISRDANTGLSLLQLKIAKDRAQELVRRLETVGFDLNSPSGVVLKSMLLVGYSPREAVHSYSALEGVAIEWYRAREMTERWKKELELQKQRLALDFAGLQERARHNRVLEQLQATEIKNRYDLAQAELQERIRHNRALEQARVLGSPTPQIDLKGLKTNTQTLSELTQLYFDRPLQTLDSELEKWQSVLSKGLGNVDPDILRQARVKYEALSSVRDMFIQTRQKTLECVQQSGMPSALAFDECRRRVNEQLLKDIQDKNSTLLAMYYTGKISNLSLEGELEQRTYAQELVRNLAVFDRNLAGAMALAIKNSGQGRLVSEAITKPKPEPKTEQIGFKDTLKQMLKDYDRFVGAYPHLYKPVKGAYKVELPGGIYQVKKTDKGYAVYNGLGDLIGTAPTIRKAFELGTKYLEGK